MVVGEIKGNEIRPYRGFKKGCYVEWDDKLLTLVPNPDPKVCFAHVEFLVFKGKVSLSLRDGLIGCGRHVFAWDGKTGWAYYNHSGKVREHKFESRSILKPATEDLPFGMFDNMKLAKDDTGTAFTYTVNRSPYYGGNSHKPRKYTLRFPASSPEWQTADFKNAVKLFIRAVKDSNDSNWERRGEAAYAILVGERLERTKRFGGTSAQTDSDVVLVADRRTGKVHQMCVFGQLIVGEEADALDKQHFAAVLAHRRLAALEPQRKRSALVGILLITLVLGTVLVLASFCLDRHVQKSEEEDAIDKMV